MNEPLIGSLERHMTQKARCDKSVRVKTLQDSYLPLSEILPLSRCCPLSNIVIDKCRGQGCHLVSMLSKAVRLTVHQDLAPVCRVFQIRKQALLPLPPAQSALHISSATPGVKLPFLVSLLASKTATMTSERSQ